MEEKFPDTDKYEDIIHLPYRQSPWRGHMPMEERAAQFAPFAALTGFGEQVRKAAEEKQEEKNG